MKKQNKNDQEVLASESEVCAKEWEVLRNRLEVNYGWIAWNSCSKKGNVDVYDFIDISLDICAGVLILCCCVVTQQSGCGLHQK